MMEIKKMITGFLILAAAAGSSALLISNINWSSAPAPTTPVAVATPSNANNDVADIGQNAYLPFTGTGAPTAITDSDAPDATTTVDDPNNLTEDLGASFLDTFSSANANSQQTDADGNPVFASPDPDQIAAELSGDPAMQNFQAPDWDIDAASVPIKISAVSSTEAVDNYAAAVSNALTSNLSASGVENSISAQSADDATVDPTTISGSATAIQGTLNNIAGIAVPPSLVNYQKDLVKMLVYEKNAVALLNVANTDPVRAALIAQAENQNYTNAGAAVEADVITLQQQYSLKNNEPPTSQASVSRMLSLVNSILGIKTANAQFGGVVYDPTLTLVTQTEDGLALQQQIWKELQNVLLQIMKNTLIRFIQQRTLAWVTGGNKPRFVQQWGVAMINQGFAAANVAINQLAQCVSPYFQKPLITTLQFYYKPGGSAFSAASCQTSMMQMALGGGGSIQQFYKNFSQGGWSAYGASLFPSGNYYGNLLFSAQGVGASVNLAQSNLKSNLTSGQGFTGDATCSDGSNPNGQHTSCLDNTSGAILGPTIGGTCPQGATVINLPNAGRCSNGNEPIVTTPAQVTNQGLAGSLTSNVHQIVNANNIIGIAVAMINSLFNSLMQVAIASATSAINQGLATATANSGSAGQLGSVTASSTAASPAPLAVACSPTSEQLQLAIASGTQISAYFGATGGTADTTGNPITYNWTTTGPATPAAATGVTFDPTFTVTTPGTYTYSVQVTGSTGGNSTCSVQIVAQ